MRLRMEAGPGPMSHKRWGICVGNASLEPSALHHWRLVPQHTSLNTVVSNMSVCLSRVLLGHPFSFPERATHSWDTRLSVFDNWNLG